MNGSIIESILGENGVFSQHIENYEVRQQQIDLSNKILSSLKNEESLIAEAPCGVGKSYAYLIPSMLYVTEKKEKVVIATANIALQEQLINKDLPFIKNVLGDKFKFNYTLLKGRNNYVCLDAVDEAQRVSLWKKFRKKDKEDILNIMHWAKDAILGDKSELEFDPSPFVWDHFSVGEDGCKKKFCPHYLECYSNKAKELAAKADIIVCNYHLLLLDLYIKSVSENGGVLPNYHVLICDEAHNLEDIARDCFSSEINPRAIKKVVAGLDRIKQKEKLNPYNTKDTENLIKSLNEQCDKFFGDILNYYKSINKEEYIRTTEKNIVPYGEICTSLLEASDLLYKIGNQLADSLDIDAQLFINIAKEAKKISENIEINITQPDDNFAYWISCSETEGGTIVSLNTKPIYVQDKLKEIAWKNIKSVIALSATMTVPPSYGYCDDVFGFMISSLGFDKNINKFLCTSPFDFKNQCGLIVPHDIPIPIKENEEQYRVAFLKNAQKAIIASNGRAMILFTSYAHLNYFYENCNDIKSKYRVLAQGSGEMNRSKMLEIFKEDRHSVLLGTSSFWEGVDIQGDSLSLLIIDKLPFPNIKQDPVLDAMRERNKKFFEEEYLPRAILTLKQGVGRLIRSKTDKGCIIIGDQRILPHFKNYSMRFLNSLPQMPFSNTIESVEEFFNYHKI